MFSPGERFNVCKAELKSLQLFNRETNVNGSATDLHVLKVHSKRYVIGLKGDIGRILQSCSDVCIDEFVSPIAAASCNTDIAEACGVSKAIDSCTQSVGVELNHHEPGKHTSQSGCNVKRNVRDGDITNCSARYDVGGALEFELYALGVGDSREECGEDCIVQGLQRLLREDNLEIRFISCRDAAHSVGLW